MQTDRHTDGQTVRQRHKDRQSETGAETDRLQRHTNRQRERDRHSQTYRNKDRRTDEADKQNGQKETKTNRSGEMCATPSA